MQMEFSAAASRLLNCRSPHHPTVLKASAASPPSYVSITRVPVRVSYPMYTSITKSKLLRHCKLIPAVDAQRSPVEFIADDESYASLELVADKDNGSKAVSVPVSSGARIGEVKRVTGETNVVVKINLDGSGVADSSTGIPFLDHMLDQLASHGLFDVHVRATGDIHIDDHHTNEDVALAIGTALLKGLGDRKGIARFGNFSAPLDEAVIHVSLDLSGRPHLSYDLDLPTQRVGSYDTQLVEHFFQSLVNTSGMTLHIRQLAGKNSHHIIEATFKAFARALRQAIECDPRRLGTVPSSKGVLSRS